MSRIPILLLTGYLGAGKTSLLNHLLSQPEIKNQNLALIINEFGALGVDGQFIKEGKYRKFELNKGSLFCICIKTDFIKTLEEINSIQPDLLIIEATGVAATRDIENFLDAPNLTDQFCIRANLCLIDCLNFTKTAPFLKAVNEQVRWADGLVLNKVDLIEKRELEKLKLILTEMNSEAPQVETSYGEIPDGFVGSLSHNIRSEPFLQTPPDPIFSLALKTEKKVSFDKFSNLIKEKMDKLLRLKGHIDFGDGTEFVELVGENLTIGEKKSKLKTGTAFTVIAWQATDKELEQQFESTYTE